MLKQNLSTKLLQKLSPQQIQFIKLLQMTTLDFEQKVEQELLDNPGLEILKMMITLSNWKKRRKLTRLRTTIRRHCRLH